jgi:hypothetical protein
LFPLLLLYLVIDLFLFRTSMPEGVYLHINPFHLSIAFSSPLPRIMV